MPQLSHGRIVISLFTGFSLYQRGPYPYEEPQKPTYSCFYHNTPKIRIQVFLPGHDNIKIYQNLTTRFVVNIQSFMRPPRAHICCCLGLQNDVFCAWIPKKMLTNCEYNSKIKAIGEYSPMKI